MERVNTQGNMRIDKADFDAVSRLILIDLLTQGRTLWLPTGRQDGTPNTQMRVLSGFTASQNTDEITVTRGTGILAIYDEGALKLGYVSADESPDSITVDMAGKSDGDWYLYMRAVILAADQENRVIWDPTTSTESVISVDTRLTPTWELVPVLSTSAPPGNGEYIPIHKVTMLSGHVTALADMRHMFFHGSVLDAHDHEWGDVAADRDGTNLIGDMHKFIQMVRRQLHDIITTGGTDLTGPLTAPPISLEKLAEEHEPVNGNHLKVNIRPVAASTVANILDIYSQTDPTDTPSQILALSDRGHLQFGRVMIEQFNYLAVSANATLTNVLNDGRHREMTEADQQTLVGSGSLVSGGTFALNNSCALSLIASSTAEYAVGVRGPQPWFIAASQGLTFLVRFRLKSALAQARIGLLATNLLGGAYFWCSPYGINGVIRDSTGSENLTSNEMVATPVVGTFYELRLTIIDTDTVLFEGPSLPSQKEKLSTVTAMDNAVYYYPFIQIYNPAAATTPEIEVERYIVLNRDVVTGLG